MRTLSVVVDLGSFQGAARATGASRTTLRRQVEQLEAMVGAPLLHRDPQGVTATEAGKLLLQGCLPLLREAQVALHMARAAGHYPQGRVRIAGPVGIPIELRATSMAALHGAYPDLAVEMHEFEDPVAALPGGFDLALHFGPPPKQDTWISRVLRQTPIRLCACDAYIEANGAPSTLEELADHALLSWRHPTLEPTAWPLCDGGAVEVSPWFTSASPALIHEMVRRGAGIGLYPDGALDPAGDATLRPVLDGVVGRPEAIRVLASRPSAAAPQIRGLMENLGQLLAGLPED